MISHFKLWISVILRGLAQMAFCDGALSGLLVLAGIAALSPASAAGALAGVVVGTVAGRFVGTWDKYEWEVGLAGPNTAIVGILWGGIFAGVQWDLAQFALALVLCLAIERTARAALAKSGLPLLSMPAVATGLALAFVYQSFGEIFWRDSVWLVFPEFGVWPAVALTGAAVALQSIRAALVTGVLVATAFVASGAILGTGWSAPVGLWGFSVAPAAFAMHAIFLANSRRGAVAGIAASVLAAGLWAAWMASPLAMIAPPLLLPFIAAVWLTILVCQRLYGKMVFHPIVWMAAREIRAARARHRSVVALTGAGASTASGIPDYVSGEWLEYNVPVSAYSYERFLTSPRCRRAYWDACGKFRTVAMNVRPNPTHLALATMERHDWLNATVTQNVDRLHQASGSTRVIELHGAIDRVRCLGCGEVSDWPPALIWRKFDLKCSHCGEFLKPGVIAMGEDLPPKAWAAARQVLSDCGVLLVVGTQIGISSAAELLREARELGAKVIFVNLGPLALPPLDGEILLEHKSEEVLPALAILLDCERSAFSSAASK